jgi:hypothetical protein
MALRWWYVRRVLTFWKMPYLIAEWAHRKGRRPCRKACKPGPDHCPRTMGQASPALQKPTHW